MVEIAGNNYCQPVLTTLVLSGMHMRVHDVLCIKFKVQSIAMHCINTKRKRVCDL